MDSNTIILKKTRWFRWVCEGKTTFFILLEFSFYPLNLKVLITFFMKKLFFSKKPSFSVIFVEIPLLTKNLISSKWWFLGVSSPNLRDLRESTPGGEMDFPGGVCLFLSKSTWSYTDHIDPDRSFLPAHSRRHRLPDWNL